MYSWLSCVSNKDTSKNFTVGNKLKEDFKGQILLKKKYMALTLKSEDMNASSDCNQKKNVELKTGSC